MKLIKSHYNTIIIIIMMMMIIIIIIIYPGPTLLWQS